jgi:hypothetical protein
MEEESDIDDVRVGNSYEEFGCQELLPYLDGPSSRVQWPAAEWGGPGAVE